MGPGLRPGPCSEPSWPVQGLVQDWGGVEGLGLRPVRGVNSGHWGKALWLWGARSVCATRAGREQVPLHLETRVLRGQVVLSKCLSEAPLQGWWAGELGAEAVPGEGTPGWECWEPYLL